MISLMVNKNCNHKPNLALRVHYAFVCMTKADTVASDGYVFNGIKISSHDRFIERSFWPTDIH
jgi:hypothetical protein